MIEVSQRINEFLSKLQDIIPEIVTTIRRIDGNVEVTSTYGEYSMRNEMSSQLIDQLLVYHNVECNDDFFTAMSRKNLLVEVALKECQVQDDKENMKKHVRSVLDGIFGK